VTRRFLLYLLLFVIATILLLFAVGQSRFAGADRVVVPGVDADSEGPFPASGNEADPVVRKKQR
jgi:hypothetical protein